MFIYKPPPRPPPYYFCLRLSVERSINALSLWCFPVRCPYWAAAVGISGLILFFLRWKALGLSVWTGGLGLWWSSNLLIRGARGGCCGSLERVCNMCQCQMEVCLLWVCVFTGRVIARVKHQEKRSKIEKLSENVRFAFLLRNIFEREWKCFALVCRAQTKDTHTHTHTVLSTHCSRDSSFLSLLCRELHERTHAPKQARAQILWVIPHLETRGLASLWVKWSPLLITRARTDSLIFWGKKKWTFIPELFRLWDVDMLRYASAPRLCTYGVRGDAHSPETRQECIVSLLLVGVVLPGAKSKFVSVYSNKTKREMMVMMAITIISVAKTLLPPFFCFRVF